MTFFRKKISLSIAATCALLLVAAAPKDSKKNEAGTEKGGTSAVQPRVCKVDIYYSWIPKSDKGSADGLQRYYGAVMDEGVDENEVRIRLKGKLVEARAEALLECKAIHQSGSECVERRLRNVALSYAKYDFPRRKIITDSVEQDCLTSAGECGEVSASEIECWGNASPDSPTVADFEPVTVETQLVDDTAADSVAVEKKQAATASDGEAVEVKKKQVLKAAPAKIVDESKAKEKEKEEPVMINAPFVVN